MAVATNAYVPVSDNWDDLTAATHNAFSGTLSYLDTYATN